MAIGEQLGMTKAFPGATWKSSSTGKPQRGLFPSVDALSHSAKGIK